jgi:hypothetical protein
LTIQAIACRADRIKAMAARGDYDRPPITVLPVSTNTLFSKPGHLGRDMRV